MWETCPTFFSATWDKGNDNLAKEGKRQRQNIKPEIKEWKKGKSIFILHAFPKWTTCTYG